jgi:prevent-host-death family protein
MSATIASRELRNATRELLARVEAGEEIIITVRGRPAAVLRPVEDQPRWLGREEFVARFATQQADSGLRDDLARLAPDGTEELGW